jgi:RNA polymerase sigma factor for flagellar operon FliA
MTPPTREPDEPKKARAKPTSTRSAATGTAKASGRKPAARKQTAKSEAPATAPVDRISQSSSGPLGPEAIQTLWASLKSGVSADARDRLILHYAPLVKFVAGRVASGLPRRIEQSDLISYGIFGLIDAIEKFEPERGFKFETYAMARIKGSIIDELRSIDWVPRSVRAKARNVERAISKLEHELRRAPDDREIAAELGVSEDEFASMMSQISFVGVAALDEVMSGPSGEGGSAMREGLRDPRQDPMEQFEQEEMRHVLADAINRMPDKERLVLTLYYYEGLTLSEIGAVLSVTESRACQIHTKAILQMRSRLAEPAM